MYNTKNRLSIDRDITAYREYCARLTDRALLSERDFAKGDPMMLLVISQEMVARNENEIKVHENN